MIFLFSDFGLAGPYVGQMTAAVLAVGPGCQVINLMHDAPAMRPDLAAYLLPACCRALPHGSIVVAVVDPGVGGERAALVVETPRITVVGPDNGLLSRLQGITRVERIVWRPDRCSVSFHGRDLFAPAAAGLAVGDPVATSAMTVGGMVGADWPDNLNKVIFVDAFGNLITGLDAENFNLNQSFTVADRVIGYAETFCRVADGQLFWYANSLGLVEIAANGRSAAALLSLALGDKILVD